MRSRYFPHRQRIVQPSSGPLLRASEPAIDSAKGLVYPLYRGPYQNNGATPWYAELQLGTPGQTMKMAFDTGSNFIWATSSLCSNKGGCNHYGDQKFDYAASNTFVWVDRRDRKVSFGPWGNMIIESGIDDFGLTPSCAIRASFYLSKCYSGSQFAQLDWDGGIGLPASSSTADPNVSFIVGELMNLGLIDPELPYISFSTDYAGNTGTCRLGGIDPDAFDPKSGIFMRWSPYLAFPGVDYLWTAALDQYFVGNTLVASNALFCLDSGSSQFKGDDAIMNETLRLVGQSGQPDVRMKLGATATGDDGLIVVPPEVYMVRIEAGPNAGEVLPQFNPLGLDNLVLVGSVLMDHLYTVHEYDVTQTATGYQLAPIGTWIFNKAGEPGLIRSRNNSAYRFTRKTVQRA